MSMTEAQKRDAYHEAQQILRLDRNWQQLMPGERKPNFKRAAREIIRRALGHKVRRNEGIYTPVSCTSMNLERRDCWRGLCETECIRPTFCIPSSTVPESRDEKPKPYMHTDDPDLPDVEVHSRPRAAH